MKPGRWALGLVVPALLVLFWQVAGDLGWTPPGSIPTPAAVIERWPHLGGTPGM